MLPKKFQDQYVESFTVAFFLSARWIQLIQLKDTIPSNNIVILCLEMAMGTRL